jgi:twitching motility protein PilT
MEIIDIVKRAEAAKASDIHLVIGYPPIIRVMGQIAPLADFPFLTPEESKRLIYSMLNESQIQRFEEYLELDTSFAIPGVSRCRVNVLVQRSGVEAVLRLIPDQIPSAEALRLTDPIMNLCRLKRGLVLVTGPTSSGKTTTLACMVQTINQERSGHILTIEDPIEFVYASKKCVIRQREIGLHSRSFSEALRHALRQDPNVIFLGEMRDLETISLAITAAETGHLVLATLHTQDAPKTVDRIVDVFPPGQQAQIRVQLSATLQGVVSQQLLPRSDGKGRIAAREVMIVTPAVSNILREGKTHMLYGAIETGLKFGMNDMDMALADLVKEGLIAANVAIAHSSRPDVLKSRMAGIEGGGMGVKASPGTTVR